VGIRRWAKGAGAAQARMEEISERRKGFEMKAQEGVRRFKERSADRETFERESRLDGAAHFGACPMPERVGRDELRQGYPVIHSPPLQFRRRAVISRAYHTPAYSSPRLFSKLPAFRTRRNCI
jgi:hypothetical protein